jgi:hypothetical protein
VAVLHIAGALDDDVGVRLEQADQLVARRHGLAVQHPALALVEHAAYQRQIMLHPSLPALGFAAGQPDQPARGPLQGRPRGMNGCDQFTVEPAPGVFAAAVLNVGGAALGQAPALPAGLLPGAAIGSSRAGRPITARYRSAGVSVRQ